jgi:3-(3-hydroxy-phenyl)propionate hydroxylase
MSASSEANSELPSTCDIAIVGAGPIGLMLANLLGAAGVNVVLVEQNDGLVGLPRAIAYDPETLRLFALIGLFDAIADGLVQDPEVVYLNARGVKLMEMAPPRSAYGHSQLGTFYQPHLEQVLLAGLARFDSVGALFNHHVTSISQDQLGVEMLVETPTGTRSLCAKFLVGCDGGNSSTRDWIGSRLVGSTYAERWLVLDTRIDNHGVDNITFFCDPRRPAVRLPAVGSRVRWEFMQLPGENPDELASDESVRRLLEPFVDFSAVEIERRVVYTFHARVADRWRKGRVFLAGDAAHLMPPFAGQGMNSGMRDVANLAWKLAAAVAGRAGDEILDTYEIERADHVRAMVNLSRRLGRVIMPTNSAIAAARDAVFALLNLSRGFRSFVRRGGLLPPPHIARSALTAARRDAVVGQMLPQPMVKLTGHERPLDYWFGCHEWLALGVGVDPRGELSPRDGAILGGLGARFLAINSAVAAAPTQPLQCRDQAFLAWAKSHRVHGILVRPDRFIAQRLDRRHDLRSLDPFAGLAADAHVRSKITATAA